MGKHPLKLKVAIIGAGITGLYLAWKLSEMGHKVTVFEKKDKIGKEACSGFFSERILGFIPQSRKLIQNRINAVVIHFPRKTIHVNFSKPFLLMSHAELDRLVADLAQRAGAEIILGRDMAIHSVLPTRLSLRSGSPHPNPFVHSHITPSLEFDRIIGCDGANSAVRKSLGIKDPSLRLGILGFAACPERAERVEWVETWAAEGGFIWRIPRGETTEYGIIAQPKQAKRLFDEFLDKKNIKIEKLISAPIPQGLIIPKNDSITFCGDAAGLTKPWSGGGVIWGLIASSMLLKNFPDFLKYRQETRKYFLPRIILSKVATKMAYSIGFNFPYLLPKSLEIESDFLFKLCRLK